MKPRRLAQASVKTEAIFGALIDVGALRFPKLEVPSDSDVARLSARMKGALKNGSSRRLWTAAELIRARRAALRLGAPQLGERAGISIRTLGGLESGRISPVEVQPEAFGKLLMALGIEFEQYVDVHGRSIKPRAKGAYRRVALKDRRDRSGPTASSGPASRGWLARLAEAMKH